MTRTKPASGFLALWLCAPSSLHAHEVTKPPVRPSLVVVVAVDQLPAGKLEEFEPQLRGGYKRFLLEGHRMTRCHHDHAATLTGPGYATLLSGLHPRNNGVIANEWYDRRAGKSIYCVGDYGEDARPDFDDPGSQGRSPDNLRGESLADLLKRADGDSRVFTVSAKDRSAILTGGHSPDGAFWYSQGTGGFTSNPSLVPELPSWGADFWAGSFVRGVLFGGIPTQWTYQERPGIRPDDYPYEEASFSRVSPHPLTAVADDLSAAERARKRAEQIQFSPWVDWMTIELAELILQEERLGQDDSPDLLVLALSGADMVGHTYGPGSQEFLDLTLRVDHWLGAFMKSAEDAVRTAGQTGVLFALSADHGVLPLPETVPGGRRIDPRMLERAGEELAARLGKEGESFIESREGNGVYLDREALESAGVALDEAIEEARRVFSGVSGIARVYRASDLKAPEGGDRFLDLHRNAWDPERGGDLVLQPCEGCLFTSKAEGTSHGSPYDYDRRVPMILLGQGAVPAVNEAPCRTVDLAPTLAWFLGLEFESPRDGTILPVTHPPGPHR